MYRSSKAKRAYDPVDYESIDKTEFWIVGEEGEAELDYDELESALLEEHPKNGEESNSNTPNGNEDESLSQEKEWDGALNEFDLDS
ncbi:unnamed protein product [Microthlaspi erraticum]|uniref:Uncharacterized protein n=1 Tax=Microthlaspi erraticum TaxID=1685480 RepID=A0A6D2KL29_9BRAS|nr:unnamed protein product [Microthlaspi erraticum]